jgi:predicted branched-subunit amino acid permease
VLEALGAPALVLGASYLGFGSFVRQSNIGLEFAVASTLSAWALPGQIALVQIYGAGASLAAIFLAVSLANVRLLPMTVSFMPVLDMPRRPAWRPYVTSTLVAVTAWAVGMMRCPQLPRDQRLPYFVGFALLLWLASLVGTVIGYALAVVVPPAVGLGLAFLNPVYFLLMFAADLRHRGRALALLLGGVGGVLIEYVSPMWGLLIVGLLGGTAAYLADRAAPQRWWPGRG